MRVRVTLNQKGDGEGIRLGLNYKEHLQALIYSLMDVKISKWLHDSGFIYNKRKYKLFTFSGMINRYNDFDYDKKEFIYNGGEVSFLIDSCVSELMYQVVHGLTNVKGGVVLLGGDEFFIKEVVYVVGRELSGERIRINAIEPIEVHRTDEKGYTHYFNPSDEYFSRYINNNLRKKWMILNKVDECPYNIDIEPVNFNKCKERVQTFKGTVIKGWTGHFVCKGDKELIEVALGCGMGSSNSKGYGIIEIVERRGI